MASLAFVLKDRRNVLGKRRRIGGRLGVPDLRGRNREDNEKSELSHSPLPVPVSLAIDVAAKVPLCMAKTPIFSAEMRQVLMVVARIYETAISFVLLPYFLRSNAVQLTTAVMVAGVSPEPVGGGATRKRLPSAVTS